MPTGNKPLLIAAAVWSAVVVAGSLLVVRYLYPAGGDLFDLRFGFGPLVESIVTRGEYRSGSFTGHRMPFVPLFLSAICLFANSLLVATLVKNALFGVLFALAARVTTKGCADVDKRFLMALLVFALSFPQLVLHSLAIGTEEGYLVALTGLLMACLIFRRGGASRPEVAALTLANASLFLIKSSMLPLAIAGCGLF